MPGQVDGGKARAINAVGELVLSRDAEVVAGDVAGNLGVLDVLVRCDTPEVHHLGGVAGGVAGGVDMGVWSLLMYEQVMLARGM